MRCELDTKNISDYEVFLKIKSLPKYRFIGNTAEYPDEYSAIVSGEKQQTKDVDYEPISGLYDYQEDIARIAIKKKKFAIFAECGLGKTLIFMEFARHVNRVNNGNGCVLMVSPLMVVNQTIEECRKFYGDSVNIQRIKSSDLNEWLQTGNGIGITNYEALRDEVRPGRLKAIIADESSIMKGHYGKWGQKLIELGRGLEWKLAGTGTPAPNDRIEYANHAVFLDHYPTVNAFLARFFVNRGQTDNRWELKPHALKPFYRALSHWCIFLTNPATYGWKDNNTGTIPPIKVKIHNIDLTTEQRELVYAETGTMFGCDLGGIGSRSVMSQIAKGTHRGNRVETNKTRFIKDLVDSFPDDSGSTIIWCRYNDEQKQLEEAFPDAVSITGSTSGEDREIGICEFKAGVRKVLISKPKILGFGLNLQIATHQVFSGLQDSYEEYHQAVKRSNRIGSTRPLEVHIPITEIERPLIDTVLMKADRVQSDTEEQERIFKESTNA